MEIHPKGLGKAVADVRRSRAMTQRLVAERSGFTVNYLSLVENGERVLSLDGLNRLAKAFKVPVEWIVFLGAEPRKGRFAGLSEATKDAIKAAIAADVV